MSSKQSAGSKTTPDDIRQQAFREAIEACEFVIGYYQREADEVGRLHARRTSPLLIRSGAAQCKSAIADVAAGRKLCERCSNPRWDIFTLCLSCHNDWLREQEAQIMAPAYGSST